MVYSRRKNGIIILLCLIFIANCSIYADNFYNCLVEDLLNACKYGYKGMNLETGEINFSNLTGEKGYVTTRYDTHFYIESEKGFFKVENYDKEILYTRDGEFIKRGNDYYLARENYKLLTKVEDCNGRKYMKKTTIFHPVQNSKIIRNGKFFKFSETESFEEVIITNRLEIPNIDPIKILFKMKSILKESGNKYQFQLELIDRMLDVLIADKMHMYYTEQSYLNFNLVRRGFEKEEFTLEQLRFIYSTSWVRNFTEYINMLYIE